MAEYYPLIARAVSGLEKDSAENRRVLYERARTALVSQLRGNVPPLEESEITRERLGLEEAIRKVEVESARRAREAPKADPLAARRAADTSRHEEAERQAALARREEAARQEETARREEIAHREEVARRGEVARREESARQEDAARRREAAQREDAVRHEEAVRREEISRREEEARREETARREEAAKAAQRSSQETPKIAPELDPSDPAQATGAPSAAPNPSEWARSAHATVLDNALENFRDAVGRPARSGEGARAVPTERPLSAPAVVPSPYPPPPPPPSQYSPPLPPYPTPPLQPTPPLLDALKELESFEPRLSQEEWPARPIEQVQPHQTFDFDAASVKSPPGESARYAEDRERPPRSLRSYRRQIGVCAVLAIIVGGMAIAYWQRDAITGAVHSVMTTIRGPATQVQRETTPSRQKNSDRLGQPNTSQTPSKGGPVATQRAMLTTEPDAGNPGGRDYVGSANWRIENIPAGPGRAAEVAIKLEVEIPDRGFAMSWLIRRNTDPTLPASHTIDIEFNLAPNSPLGEISEIRSLLMKQPGQTEGAPLWGHAQKSTSNYFLVGLSATEADAQYNLRQLKGQQAFDVALVFTKARRAFLLIEKGPVGERVFAEAFAAWKQ